MGRCIALTQLNTLLRQLGAHRWIDIGVRAAHLHPVLTRQQRDPPHKRSADAKNMNMHSNRL